jgi:hypothetical protein
MQLLSETPPVVTQNHFLLMNFLMFRKGQLEHGFAFFIAPVLIGVKILQPSTKIIEDLILHLRY